MAMESLPDQPFPLIQIGADERFIVNEEVAELLSRIEGSLAVICVAGLYRTGKSSLLNWLGNRSAGFKVGPTVEACTKGIWIWGKPIVIQTGEGQPLNVLLMDTEGLGGLEASQRYDVRIFSLATLLCSRLVYNSLGSIDETAIQNLSFIANLAQHIRLNPKDQTEEDGHIKELAKVFPSFTWVIRDFSLCLSSEKGEDISSSQYLEQALQPQMGSGRQVIERNRTRQALCSFFSERECFTLVRPVIDEEALQKVDELPMESLRVEFQAQLLELRSSLFSSSLRPQKVNGKEVNGSMFLLLLRSYVEAINGGGVPTLSSAWEEVSRSECKLAVEDAVKRMKKGVSSLLRDFPMEESNLREQLAELIEVAVSLFLKRAIGPDTKHWRSQLLEALRKEERHALAENEKMSLSSCSRLLQTLFTEFLKQEQAGGSAALEQLESFVSRWGEMKRQYLETASGPCKHAVLAEFTESKLADAFKTILYRREKQHQDKLREVKEESSKATASLALLEGKEMVYTRQLQTMQEEQADSIRITARREGELKDLREATEALKAKTAALEAESVALRNRHAEQLGTLREELKAEREAHQECLQRLKKLEVGAEGCNCVVQ